LDDVNSGLLRLFQKPRVGLDIGVVNDDGVGLFLDQRRDRLRAGVGAPVRIANLDRHPERFERLL
jgi:hypothetical protein